MEDLVSFSEIMLFVQPVLAGCVLVQLNMAEVSGGIQVSDVMGMSEGVVTELVQEEECSCEESHFLYIDDLNGLNRLNDDEEIDVNSLYVSNVFYEVSRESVAVDVVITLAENFEIVFTCETLDGRAVSEVSMLGLPGLPDPGLLNAGKGQERLPWENNDRWAMK